MINVLLFCIFRHFSFDDCELYCGFIPGGVLNKFLYGEAPPEVQSLILLYTIFHEKGPPFVYLLLTNGSPFKYLV